VTTRRSALAVGFAGLLALPALAACSSDSASSTASASAIKVTSSDTTCELSTSTIAAGKTTFAVTNTGSQVTEVYVYGMDGDAFTKIVSEVENIGPSTSRDMSADLTPGTYEVACKPGQTGSGIRSPLTVTGERSGSASASPTTAKVAQVIKLSTNGTELSGVTGKSGTNGERIEFVVTNTAPSMRNFEVKRPDGSVAGEVEIEAGKAKTLPTDLTAAGSWKLIIEGGSTVITKAFPVS